MAARIRKGDRVVVIAGRDKGRQGEVLRVIPAESRVVVQGVQLVKKHQKPCAANPNGGIASQEAPIHGSKVAHVDPREGKPRRIAFRSLEDGRKVGVAARYGEQIDR